MRIPEAIAPDGAKDVERASLQSVPRTESDIINAFRLPPEVMNESSLQAISGGRISIREFERLLAEVVVEALKSTLQKMVGDLLGPVNPRAKWKYRSRIVRLLRRRAVPRNVKARTLP